MASTACSEACLALYLHAKSFSVSRALAAHVTAPLSSGRAARSRRKSQLGYFLFRSVALLPGNSEWIQTAWNQGLSWADAGGPARGWAGPDRPARPGPPVFDMMGRGPARPINFLEDGPRPGPTHHIKKKTGPARPGPSFYQKSRPRPARSITWQRGP